MVPCLRYVVPAVALNLACAPGQVAPVEYPVSKLYQADTASVLAALDTLAKALDVASLHDDPWKQTTTLRLHWHWNEGPKIIRLPKPVEYARYMRCPDDPKGKTLGVLPSRQRAFDLRVQLRPVQRDTVAVQLGAAAWEEPENTEDAEWTKCESTGYFEATVLAGIDSLLTTTTP